jgi:hypothetical protein
MSANSPRLICMKMVVAVSLFGNLSKYSEGALRLQSSISRNLESWTLVIFHSRSVASSVLSLLESNGAELRLVPEEDSLAGMAWRFSAVREEGVSKIIFRDCDSIISKREANMVQKWVQSGYGFHLIRDHPFHLAKIMGGLWGVDRRWFSEISKRLDGWEFSDDYGTDQEFLASEIYPLTKGDRMISATFHAHEGDAYPPFPHSLGWRFGTYCGESVTSGLVTRVFARLARLVGRSTCRC